MMLPRRHDTICSSKFILDILGALPLDWLILDTVKGSDDLHQYLSWIKLLQLVGIEPWYTDW